MVWQRWRSHLDVAAHIAVVATCLLLSTMVVNRALTSNAHTGRSEATPVSIGTVLEPTDEIRFAGADFTLLLGFSTTCRFCQDSIPALQLLRDDFARFNNRLKVFALSVQPREVLAGYLAQQDLSSFHPIHVKSLTHLVPIVRQTPTIVIVDQSGRVRATWVGLIDEKRVGEIRRLVANEQS